MKHTILIIVDCKYSTWFDLGTLWPSLLGPIMDVQTVACSKALSGPDSIIRNDLYYQLNGLRNLWQIYIPRNWQLLFIFCLLFYSHGVQIRETNYRTQSVMHINVFSCPFSIRTADPPENLQV